MSDPKPNPPKSTTAAESGAKPAPLPEPPVKPIEGPRPDNSLPGRELPPYAIQLPVFPEVPPEPGPEEPPVPQPVKPKLGDRFEVKWTVRHGFILVPVSAEPK